MAPALAVPKSEMARLLLGGAGYGRRVCGVHPRSQSSSSSGNSEPKMNFVDSWNAILTIAYKEFIHIWRDRRVLLLILVLPPFFTVVFGHAFGGAAIPGVTTPFLNTGGGRENEKITTPL